MLKFMRKFYNMGYLNIKLLMLLYNLYNFYRFSH